MPARDPNQPHPGAVAADGEQAPPPGRTLSILTTAQALYLCGISIDMTLTGIVGYQLAPSPMLATIPFALISVGSGIATYPISLFMGRYGRRTGFLLGSGAAAAGGLISLTAIWSASFPLFCLGVACIGVYQAVAGYYRYAAADASPPERRARAIATVLSGGIVAALVGPLLATLTRDVLPIQFAGAYLLVTVLALGSLAVLYGLPPNDAVTRSTSPEEDGRPARTLGTIARDPRFVAGLAGSAIAYLIMSLTMTAAPIAGVHHGHTIDQGANVIQFHMMGMFGTALISGRLAQRIGTIPTQLVGAGVLASGLLVAATGSTQPSFLIALALNGVGWNLMYVTSSALIADSYEEHERARVQGVGELCTLGGSALGALSAGAMLAAAGWATTVALLLIPLCASVALTVRCLLARRRVAGEPTRP